jgi:hypothetical protein
LRFTDADGHRITAFITDTGLGVVAGQLAGLELRHRQHVRVEDRIREAKATGLTNLPFHSFDANTAWLEIILTATDLVAWSKLTGFTDHRDLTTCEIDTFRCRVLHVAARITRGARQTRLSIDSTWWWTKAIATAWQRIRIRLAPRPPDRPTTKDPLALGRPAPPGDAGPLEHALTRRNQTMRPPCRRASALPTRAKNRG